MVDTASRAQKMWAHNHIPFGGGHVKGTSSKFLGKTVWNQELSLILISTVHSNVCVDGVGAADD